MKGKSIIGRYVCVVLILICTAISLFSGCDLLMTGGDANTSLTPGIPQNVQVNVSGATIIVTWDDVAGAEGYTVYYYKDGDLYEQSAQVNTNSFTHTDPLSGTRYYYKVKARIGNEFSQLSTQVSEILASYTFTVDLPSSYFSSMGTTSAEIEVNGNVLGTIESGELGQGYTSFDFTIHNLMDDFAVRTGTFYNYFDDLDDFASGTPDSLEYLFEISKVVLYPKYDFFSSNLTGTGAYASPRQPSFSILSSTVTSDSFSLELEPYESVEGYTYDVYVSTEEYDDSGWTVVPMTNSTRINMIPVDAATNSTYTVSGLLPSTEYHVMVATWYDGIENSSQYARSVTTAGENWTDGILFPGETKYYSFEAVSGSSYTIFWDDTYQGSGSYSCDIKVGAYEGGETRNYLFEDIDSGYTAGREIIAPNTERIYLKVRGYSSTSSGSYALRVIDAAGLISISEEIGVDIPVEIR